MIYIAKGHIGNKIQEVKTELSDFEAIRKSKIQVLPDVEKLHHYKRHTVHYFVAGKFKELVRNNKNLIHKTIITLDFDGVSITRDDFITHLKQTIGENTFYTFPSIRNGIDGLRYRVVIEPSREFNTKENSTVMAYISRIIGLDGYDESANTFSQLQSLKVTFGTKEAYEEECYFNQGELFNVDEAIQLQQAYEKENPETIKRTQKPFIEVNYTRKKTFTASFLEELIQEIGSGERNVYLTRITGKLLSLGMTPGAAYEWIHLINDNFITPALREDEVNTIFRSILKAEQEKLKKGG